MPDFDAIGTALAARFAPGVTTAPTGYDPITISTGDLPEGMYPMPCVLTFYEAGTFTHSAGKRDSVHTYTVRFYFNQTGDLERDMVALRKWLTVLVDQLKLAAQLGGIVTQAKVIGSKLGTLTYAQIPYSGLELAVMVNVNEPWSPVA
jgi:hypothetical protein